MDETLKVISDIDNTNIFPEDTSHPILFDNNVSTYVQQVDTTATIDTKGKYIVKQAKIELNNNPSLARGITVYISGSNDKVSYTQFKYYTQGSFPKSIQLNISENNTGYRYYKVRVYFDAYAAKEQKLASISLIGFRIPDNRSLVMTTDGIKKFNGTTWNSINSELKDIDFIDEGIAGLSILNRKITDLKPLLMTDKSEAFSKTIDLKKYSSIKDLKVQAVSK